jgi:hypothetical protein
MEQVCANYVKCPIYSGILKEKNVASASYKKQYCEAGASGWNKCKRFQVREKCGKCPSDLLPNSFKSIEDIVASMN